jgi:hypothetical protein
MEINLKTFLSFDPWEERSCPENVEASSSFTEAFPPNLKKGPEE